MGQWPFVHTREESFNKSVKIITGNGILDNFEMKDSVERESRKDGVLGAPGGKLGAVSAVTTQRPCVRPPQGQSIEMTLVGEDELLRAEMSRNEYPVLLAILLISLESRARSLLFVG